MSAVLSLWRNRRELPFWVLFRNYRDVFKKDELGVEIAEIAVPSALALTADPIASLIDTAFIGHIGPVELAAVGVSIAVFNQVSKIVIFPLVSVTTSFVAEEETVGGWSDDAKVDGRSQSSFTENSEMEELILHDSESNLSSVGGTADKHSILKPGRRHIPAASTAMILGALLGLIQALFVVCAARFILSYMGVGSDSPMLSPALRYLTLRALGAPAILLSIAMQGVFRGFKDTKTPLYATVAGDVANIILDAVLMFVFSMGVTGAAIAHVISQYIICLILLWRLMKEVDLFPPHLQDLQFRKFLKNGFLVFLKVVAATSCVTLAASLAARLGSINMAAFQICLQIWLATSLLADGLAVAGQAILASAFARKDFEKVTVATSRVLQLGLALGILLALVLISVLKFVSRLFTDDIYVLRLIDLGIPFVAATQPINTLAFVFDGINYGVSDFAYSAYSMVIVAVLSILCLFVLSSFNGFVGLWVALTIYMSLRALAGFWRIGTGSGPWRFLRN